MAVFGNADGETVNERLSIVLMLAIKIAMILGVYLGSVTYLSVVLEPSACTSETCISTSHSATAHKGFDPHFRIDTGFYRVLDAPTSSGVLYILLVPSISFGVI